MRPSSHTDRDELRIAPHPLHQDPDRDVDADQEERDDRRRQGGVVVPVGEHVGHNIEGRVTASAVLGPGVTPPRPACVRAA